MAAARQEVPSVIEKVLHNIDFVEIIAKNISLKQRWNLALTDKSLYSIICKLDAKRYQINLMPENLTDSSTVDSMIYSERILDTIGLYTFYDRNSNSEVFGKIIAKHGQTMKKLSCHWMYLESPSTTFETEKLPEFFQNFENLAVLEIWFAQGVDLPCPSFLNKKNDETLKNLKKFSFNVQQNVIRPYVFNCFSTFIASDTIAEFKYRASNFCGQEFIIRQSNIKAIEIFPVVDAKYFAHLKLEKIESFPSGFGDNESLQQIIEDHHETLRVLEAAGMQMSEETVVLLCDRLKKLEELTIRLTIQNAESFQALNRLTELKSLSIFCGAEFFQFDSLAALTLLKLPNIIKAKIVSQNNFFADPFLVQIGDNWENVEKLTIHQTLAITNGGTLQLNPVLEHVKKLKILNFHYRREFQGLLITEFTYNGQIYPLMEEFSANYCRDIAFICTLNIFPNLRKLTIKCVYGGPLQLKGFIALKKLKELDIALDIKSTLITLSSEEISLFMQWCHQVEKFNITIRCPIGSEFCDQLSAAMSDHVDVTLSNLQGIVKLLMNNIKY